MCCDSETCVHNLLKGVKKLFFHLQKSNFFCIIKIIFRTKNKKFVNAENTPLVLIVLDGFGIAPPNRANAITMARTPILDNLLANYGAMTLHAASEMVGLPWAEMGNSEVGHISIGAGRIIYQNLPRINKSIETGDFFENNALRQAMEHAKKNGSQLHLMGLVSPGGIHSHIEHLYALLEMSKKEGIKDVLVHAILDGRDTPPTSAQQFIEQLEERMKKIGVGKIVSMSGRFYAMDRDNRWDRIEKAYRAIAEGEGEKTFSSPTEAMKHVYNQHLRDEEFPPTVITEKGGKRHQVKDHDGIIFFNFRPDRARQLTKALILPGFNRFKKPREISDLFMTTMTEYEENLPVAIAFPKEDIKNTLSEVIANDDLAQIHIAETEKYAHVTFFFAGHHEKPFPKEKRILVPSPQVTNYAERPEMSAYEITERSVQEISSGAFAFAVINFANADMIGHVGKVEETIKAIEVLDKCLGRITQTVLAMQGVVVIVGDHGNAEEMLDPSSGQLLKSHTTNPVPFMIIGNDWRRPEEAVGEVTKDNWYQIVPSGALADVAPTILKIMGLPIPADMTGKPLT